MLIAMFTSLFAKRINRLNVINTTECSNLIDYGLLCGIDIAVSTLVGMQHEDARREQRFDDPCWYSVVLRLAYPGRCVQEPKLSW